MNKAISIILDGATPKKIYELVEEGKLPTFKKIREEGFSCELNSTSPPITGAAMASYMAGTKPEKHGIYDYMRIKGGGRNNIFEYGFVSYNDIKCKPFWKFLGEKERKVIIVGIPLTYPAEEVNGVIISHLGLHSPPMDSYPSGLSDILKKKFGEDKLNAFYNRNNPQPVLDSLYKVNDIKVKYGLYLLQKFEWDFFAIHIPLVDTVQHFFWKYMDPDHPEYPGDGKFKGAIDKSYVQLDKYVSLFIDKLKELDIIEQTNVFLNSDHGFGPQYGSVNLNKFLLDKNILKIKEDVLTKIKYSFFKLGLTPKTVFNLLSHLRLQNLIERFLSPEKTHELSDSFFPFSTIDFEKTLAFSFGHFNQVYINKPCCSDKSPITSKEKYEKVKSILKNCIKELKNPKSNRELLKSIVDLDNYENPAPDLIFDFGEYITYPLFMSNPTKIFNSATINTSGTHRKVGFFIASGPDIRIKNTTKVLLNIWDVAPNILHILNVPIPKHMDGRVLKELFKEHSEVRSREVKYEDRPEIKSIIEELKKKGKI